jgi:hypothetical protein
MSDMGLTPGTSPDGERDDLELEEVIRALATEGYDDAFVLHEGNVACPACNARFAPEGEPVEGIHQARDTMTNQDDLIVLAVRCPECDTLGYVAGEPSAIAGSGAADAEEPRPGGPHAGYERGVTDSDDSKKPGATESRPLGQDRKHFIVVEDGDLRSLRDRGPLLDEDGDDIRQYTGEPVETEEGVVIPQQQNVGPGNQAGGGEWPDPEAPPAQP